jgi:hypothetical protein
MKTPKKTIYVQCTAKTHLTLEQFRMIPNHLKDRKRKSIEKLAKLIIEHGFLFPPFVWKHDQSNSYTILDGHGRYNALKLLEKKGYTIPPIPVVVVEADNEQHARKKMLEAGNRNGQFDFGEFEKFTKDLKLDLDGLFVPNITDCKVATPEVGFFPDSGVATVPCPHCGKLTPVK